MKVARNYFNHLIQETYKKEDYLTKGLYLPLHYLIALKQKKTIPDYVDKIKNSKWLTKKDQYGFTPLILSVILGDFKTLILLLKKIPKEHLNDQDKKGWSAYHHSLWQENESLEKILLENGLLNSITLSGARLKNLKNHSQSYPISFPTTIEYVENSRKIVKTVEQLAPEKLFELTGIKNWSNNPSPLSFWLDDEKEKTCPDFKKEKYNDWKQNPPQLVIRETGTKINESRNFILLSKKIVQRDSIIGEYNPEHNFSKFLVHGLPNVRCCSLKIDGVVRKLLIVISAHGIPAGGIICIDKSLKVSNTFDKMILYQKKLIQVVFKYVTFENLSDNNLDTLFFALNNPTILLYLHFSSTQPIQFFCKLLEKEAIKIKENPLQNSFLKTFLQNPNYLKICSVLSFLKDFDEKNSEEQKKEASSWILKNIQTTTLVEKIIYLKEQMGLKEDLKNFVWEDFISKYKSDFLND